MAATSRSASGAPVRDLMDGLHATLLGFKQMAVPHLVRVGLTPAQFWTLNNLNASGEVSCGPLASRLGITLPSVTALVDPLERAGLVRRVRSSEDRRVVRLALTARGTALLGRVWAQIEKEVAERVRDLSPREIAAAARVLAALGGRPAELTPPEVAA